MVGSYQLAIAFPCANLVTENVVQTLNMRRINALELTFHISRYGAFVDADILIQGPVNFHAGSIDAQKIENFAVAS